MARQYTLKDQADAKGISERALIIDAVDGAESLDAAAQKLGISRQGLGQAMSRWNIDARVIRHLEVIVHQKEQQS